MSYSLADSCLFLAKLSLATSYHDLATVNILASFLQSQYTCLDPQMTQIRCAEMCVLLNRRVYIGYYSSYFKKCVRDRTVSKFTFQKYCPEIYNNPKLEPSDIVKLESKCRFDIRQCHSLIDAFHKHQHHNIYEACVSVFGKKSSTNKQRSFVSFPSIRRCKNDIIHTYDMREWYSLNCDDSLDFLLYSASQEYTMQEKECTIAF